MRSLIHKGHLIGVTLSAVGAQFAPLPLPLPSADLSALSQILLREWRVGLVASSLIVRDQLHARDEGVRMIGRLACH